jgi:hypothetical protein
VPFIATLSGLWSLRFYLGFAPLFPRLCLRSHFGGRIASSVFFFPLPLGSLLDCFELLQKFEDKECVARRRAALFCKPVLQEYFVSL